MSDLASIFRLSVDPLEIIVRGTLMYWFLFGLFRFVLRRDVGSIAIADVLLLVLIADAAQNAMAGGYESLTDGCILVSTIAFWNYLVDWLSYRYPPVARLLQPGPLEIVREGRMLRAQMRREMITTEELKSKLRETGIEDLAEVKQALMESNGEISVIRYDENPPPQKKGKKTPPA